MHKVLDGPIDKSYGVHVAKLSGMPSKLTDRASEILKEYETSDSKETIKTSQIAFDFTEKKESKVEVYLEGINIDDITPKMAMDILYNAKDLMK